MDSGVHSCLVAFVQLGLFLWICLLVRLISSLIFPLGSILSLTFLQLSLGYLYLRRNIPVHLSACASAQIEAALYELILSACAKRCFCARHSGCFPPQKKRFAVIYFTRKYRRCQHECVCWMLKDRFRPQFLPFQLCNCNLKTTGYDRCACI